jgi:lysophospholipase L1-like esterase
VEGTTVVRRLCALFLAPLIGFAAVGCASRPDAATPRRARVVARQEKAPLVDVLALFEAYAHVPGQDVRDLLIPNDDIHANDAGYALIAQWLLEVILADLAAGRSEVAS